MGVIIIKNLNKYSQGYLVIDDGEFIAFINKEPYCVPFKFGNICYNKTLEKKKMEKISKSDDIVYEDYDNIVFTEPVRKAKSVIFNLIIDNSGPRLTVEDVKD